MNINGLDLKGLTLKFLLLLTLLLCTFNCAAGTTDWIDFNLEGGHVKIPAKISNIDTYAILDTGAQINAINKAFVNKHQLSFEKGSKTRVQGVFGTEDKPTLRDVPVSFFGIESTLNKITQLSLGYHTNGLLLGSGFFDKFVTQLDYPNKKMRLITHDSIKLNEFENIEVQSQKGTGMPIVKVGLPNDEHLWLLLDTGNAGGLIVKRKVANKMGWLKNTNVESGITMGATSIAATESFRIPTLQFGPFELEQVLVTIPALGQKSQLGSQYQNAGSKIKGRKVQGIIGYDVLKHFLITIDYKGGHAHIGLPEE